MNKFVKKIKNISLKTELLANLLLLVFISMLASLFFVMEIGYESLEEQILVGMDMAVENKEGQLLEFMNYQKSRASDFSTDGLILTGTREIIINGNDSYVSILNEHLRDEKAPLSSTITVINIIDIEGNIIASSNDSNLGEKEDIDNNENALRSLSFRETYATDIEQLDNFSQANSSIRVFAPIVDQRGDVIGYLVNYVAPDNLNKIIAGTRKGELGANVKTDDEEATSNVYVINKDGFIISGPRNSDFAPFQKEASIEPYYNCLNGIETAGVYKSYDSELVVGSSVCTINNWTLVSEVTTEEAFASIKEFQRNIIIVSLVLFGAATLVAYGLTVKNINPINELSNTVTQFGRGNFSKRANIKRENEIGQLANEFNKMADKIEELDKSKTEFISFVSHQLKNPLSVISLNLELLKDKISTKNEKEEYINTIERTISDTAELIDNLLNVSRIESRVSRLNKERIDLREVVKSVIDRLRAQADVKKISITESFTGDTTIVTDSHMLKVVVENLLSNAIKYTPEGGNISARATNQGGKILLEIKDTGYGIPKKDQKKIFKKFFRGDSENFKKSQGTGLGLYMVDKMVKKMGGEIKLESKEGEGAKFSVYIPIK